MKELIKNYVDTGTVKIVFKDYQFLGPDSTTAALYGRAVWELYPDKYFIWHEAMVKKQDAENGGFGNETSVKNLTATISGIDGAKVSEKVSSSKDEYQKAIEADKAEGDAMGIQGTPGFVIGKENLFGAQPLSAFTPLIDSLLK